MPETHATRMLRALLMRFARRLIHYPALLGSFVSIVSVMTVYYVAYFTGSISLELTASLAVSVLIAVLVYDLMLLTGFRMIRKGLTKKGRTAKTVPPPGP